MSLAGRYVAALEKLTGVVVDIADLIAVMADDIESIREMLSDKECQTTSETEDDFPSWSECCKYHGVKGHNVVEFYPPDDAEDVLTPEQVHEIAAKLMAQVKEREKAELEWQRKHDPEKVRYQYAGKLGPWARGGCKGTRYLDTGLQGKPIYSRIIGAAPEDDESGWRWISVQLENEHFWQVVRWCGCNTYE